MSVSTLVSIALGFVLVCWAVGAHNRLVRLKSRIAQAFGQVDAQLKQRHALVPNLVEAAKTYLQHEQAALEAVAAARTTARNAGDAARSRPAHAASVQALGAAEQALDGSLGRLLAVAEAYPELKADPALRETADELIRTDNQIGFARQVYNGTVRDYNQAQGQFPTVLVARLFGFMPSAEWPAPVAGHAK